jgi:crotonobetaine/carnitine-CoA ligase
VAAIAPFAGKGIDPKSVYEMCKKDLEANYIPSFLHLLDDLPKTLTEKPLARELREMFERGEGTVFKLEDYR